MIIKSAASDVPDRTADYGAKSFSLSPDIFCVFDGDGIIRSVNSSCLRILGRAPDELIGRSFFEFVHPDDRAAAGMELERVKAGQPVVHFESRCLAKDGSIRWLACSCSGRQTPDDLLFAVARDVTERRLLEAARKAAEDRFRAIVEAAPTAILMTDTEGRITFCNPQVGMMFGYANSELLGAGIELLIPERLRAIHVAHRGAFAADPQRRAMGARKLLSARRKDGSEFPVDVALSPMPAPEGTSVLCVIADLSERFQAQQALETSEREARQLKSRLELILNSIGEGICGLDLVGRFTFINRAGEAMLGWPGAEIIGKPYDEILHHTKTRVEDADQQRPIDLTLQFGTSCWFEKDEFSRRDGTTFPVEFTSTPLRDDDRGAGAVVVFRDISERQRRMLAEHELRTARALQRLLYPAAPPQLPGFDIAGAVFPAAMACGDYFDFVPLPDGQLAFAVGDVSGHGLGSALYMVQTRAYLRAILKSDHDEVGVVKRLNELLVQNKSDDFFLTLFFGTLDPRTGTLRYAGAGHDARLLRADGTVEELPSTGTVLAIFEDLKLRRVAPLRLHPGDMLLLVTDGLTETYAPDRSMWGWPPILDLAGQHRERPATSLVETLKKEAEGFAQGGPQLDDVTIVVAKVL